jgi:hypothetical protein
VEARVARDREAETSLDLGRRSLISINTVRTDTNIKEEVQARGLTAKGNLKKKLKWRRRKWILSRNRKRH